MKKENGSSEDAFKVGPLVYLVCRFAFVVRTTLRRSHNELGQCLAIALGVLRRSCQSWIGCKEFELRLVKNPGAKSSLQTKSV